MNLHFEQGYYWNLLTRDNKWHDHSIFELYFFPPPTIWLLLCTESIWRQEIRFQIKMHGSKDSFTIDLITCLKLETWNFWENPTFCHRKSEIFGQFSSRFMGCVRVSQRASASSDLKLPWEVYFCISNTLTRLTWLIHTSFLPSKWNLYPKDHF